MRLLALCGSLRKNSLNLACLNEAKRRFSESCYFYSFDHLAELPAFNPDLTEEPDSVSALREAVRSADAIFIFCPEYVHGIPGVLKNALDWLVGSGEWDGKPTGLIHVTPSANEPEFVREGLKEVIRVMSGGRVVDEASFTVTGASKKFDSSGLLLDKNALQSLDHAFESLLRASKAIQSLNK